jgi:hypothetical protein
MVAFKMKPGSTVRLTLAVLAFGATRAAAQDVIAPDGSVTRPTKFERACGPALARFCPELSDTPGQTRNQVICLKAYRSSLMPYCRAAVNAALQ